jgi:hypothetical protein
MSYFYDPQSGIYYSVPQNQENNLELASTPDTIINNKKRAHLILCPAIWIVIVCIVCTVWYPLGTVIIDNYNSEINCINNINNSCIMMYHVTDQDGSNCTCDYSKYQFKTIDTSFEQCIYIFGAALLFVIFIDLLVALKNNGGNIPYAIVGTALLVILVGANYLFYAGIQQRLNIILSMANVCYVLTNYTVFTGAQSYAASRAFWAAINFIILVILFVVLVKYKQPNNNLDDGHLGSDTGV